jgi:hypothetical protein
VAEDRSPGEEEHRSLLGGERVERGATDDVDAAMADVQATVRSRCLIDAGETPASRSCSRVIMPR